LQPQNINDITNFVNNLNSNCDNDITYIYNQDNQYVATLYDYQWLIPVNETSFYYITNENIVKDNYGREATFLPEMSYAVSDLNLNIYYTTCGYDLHVYGVKSNRQIDIYEFDSEILYIEPLSSYLWVQTSDTDYLFDYDFQVVRTEPHRDNTIRTYYSYDIDIYAEYNYETEELIEYNTQGVIECYCNVSSYYYDLEGNLIVSDNPDLIFQDIFLKVSKQPINLNR